MDSGIISQPFHVNGNPAQIGAHGEVGNGSRHGDCGGDIEEDTVSARLHGGGSNDGKRSGTHHRADSVVEI